MGPDQVSRRPASPWAVFAAVALGTFMATLDSSIVNVTLPTLARTFEASVTEIEWISLAYVLAITGLLLPFGRLGDAIGRKRVFLWGMALFTAGSALCGLARSTEMLIGARLLQGIGASMASANSIAIITYAVPAAMRGRALGLVGAVVGLGLTVGPPLGGFIVAAVGWPWIFFVNLPIGVFAVLYGARTLPEDAPAAGAGAPRGALRGVHLASTLLVAGSLVAGAVVLSRGATWGWTSAETLTLAAIAVVLGGVFVALELRSSDPLVDLRLFADPLVRTPMLALFLSFTALFTAIFLVPFYLERVAGLGPASVGQVLVIIPLLLLTVSPLSGAWSDRLGTSRLAITGLGVTSFGLVLLAWLVSRTGDQAASVASLVGGLFVVGLGQGLFQAPNSSAAMSAVPADRLGTGGGLLSTMRNLGTLVGIGVAAAIYEGREHAYARTLSETRAAGLGMRDAFLFAALVAAVAALQTAATAAAAARMSSARQES